MRRAATLVSVIAGAVLLAGCAKTAATSDVKRTAAATDSDQSRPSFATVLVDFSASFAPLNAIDKAALSESASALADLAVKEWSPPVTITWKKIGTNSAASKALCGPFGFSPHLVSRTGDSSENPEKLRTDLKQCSEKLAAASRDVEQYTDLDGAIATASQDWADVVGEKALLILSDFVPDYKKGTGPADLHLHGERVVMLPRMGSMDMPDVTTYLSRIAAFRASLLKSGAKSVTIIPTFRATKASIIRALSSNNTPEGVRISMLNDLRPEQNDEPLFRAIGTMSNTLAGKAKEWPSPVILTWFNTGIDGHHTDYFPPIEFIPHLVQRSTDSLAELGSPEQFRDQVKEFGSAMIKRCTGNGDLAGALRLISETDEPATLRVIFIISGLSRTPPSAAPPLNLTGSRIVLLYRISGDSASFQKNLAAWKGYLARSGTSQVCAFNLTNVTASQEFCVGNEVNPQ